MCGFLNFEARRLKIGVLTLKIKIFSEEIEVLKLSAKKG